MKRGRSSGVNRRLAIAAVTALALSIAGSPGSPVSPATAAPADRPTALAAVGAVTGAAQVPSGWTGSVAGCVPGTESPESLAATLGTVNTLRSFAGVGEVAFSPEKNSKALAAALMMRAKGSLSHYPDPAWPCYSESGADGASSSNLYIGGAGLESSGASAMLAYLNDNGVESLGHRRWLLHPGAVELGSGSTGSTNALYVLASTGDDSRQNALLANSVVAWPPAGWVPWPWFFRDWSVAIGRPAYDAGAPDYVAISPAPTVTVRMDGQPLPVQNVRVLDGGYGTGPMLTWQVSVPPAAEQRDATIDVAVAGATLAGAPLPINYRVQAFNSLRSSISPPQSVPKACPALRKKLKRTNRRAAAAARTLKRLKRRAAKSDSRARYAPKMKRARRNLKIAKRAQKKSKRQVQKRCEAESASRPLKR